YLASVSESEATWLPHSLGYAGTLAATLVVLAVLLVAIVRWSGRHRGGETRPGAPDGLIDLARRIFVDRWPPVVAGTIVAALSAFYFFRVAPLGVTAELGSIARTAGSSWGLLPDTLLGLDGL